MRREREIPQNARAFIIQEVIRNAEMIGKRISDNDITEEAYARSTEFQDLLTMPMLRICELVSEYQSVFRKSTPPILGKMSPRCAARLPIRTEALIMGLSGKPSWLTCPV